MHQAEEYPSIPLSRRLLDQAATFISTGGYSGYARIVPGTVGSLVGLLLYLPAIPSPIGARIAATVAVFFLGVFASSRVAAIWRIKDPHPIVIDEIVGMWISLMFVPPTVLNVVSAFVLFRLFDIVKPFPARQAEELPGGWGIMVDDVIAGIYAGLLLFCGYNLASSFLS